MTKKFSIVVETAGRSCNGCTKCCEGYLVAEIYGFKMSPTDGGCRFLARSGCGIYPVREPLCKYFQCDWKENYTIEECMKPNLSNVIILTKNIEEYIYYRLIVAGTPIKEYVFDWADEQAKKGKHIVGYNNDGKFVVFSANQRFKELMQKLYTETGV